MCVLRPVVCWNENNKHGMFIDKQPDPCVLTHTVQDAYKTLVGPAFEVQVGLHELLGHGSGKMFMNEKDCEGVEDPLTGTECQQRKPCLSSSTRKGWRAFSWA